MNKLYLIIFSAVLISCGGQKEASNSAGKESSSQAEEVKELVFPMELAHSQDKFTTLLLPLEGGEGFMDSVANDAELAQQEFDFLSQNFRKTFEYDDYYIKECTRINELKKNGKYKEYRNTLDIGMLANCTAHPYATVKSEDALLILWMLNYTSYEACPYFTGRELYASKIIDGKVISSFMIASESSAGDPPVAGTTITNFKLDIGYTLKRQEINESFEDDELMDKSVKDTIVIF